MSIRTLWLDHAYTAVTIVGPGERFGEDEVDQHAIVIEGDDRCVLEGTCSDLLVVVDRLRQDLLTRVSSHPAPTAI